jgi:thiol:disulfide interchange protein DsbD
MKQIKIALFYLALLFLVNAANGQILKPVKWTTSVNKISGQEYELVIKARIDDHWHLYSQQVPEGGPIPTTFYFKDSLKTYQFIGKTQEGKGIESFDNVFQMNIKYFEKESVFKQKVRILNPNVKTIGGMVEFMACDDKSCLPPTEVDLTFNIGSVSDKSTELISVLPETDTVQAEQPVEVAVTDAVVEQKSVEMIPVPKKEKQGLWGLFFLSFLAGFAALLTPCVFPMIPMTVSFFTKQSKNRTTGIRNAILFGLAIIVIYVLLGSVVTPLVGGADSLNALATNVWFNIIFFLLLVVFAVSFLGAFEITLPSSWSTKVDSQADRGGLIGIFFMALALAIVSFSCTGPIVGTALVAAATKGGIAPVISMFGFSLAIALPFSLFAAFPGWMNSLPKSGGWLNTVKVVLGFLELALAFKFLSNADLVLQTHLLEREVFLAIWITIFGALAFYLFGKIKLPHDGNLAHLSVGRLTFGLVVLAFTIYMIPGLWGAPLKLISGFPPPMQYSESPNGVGYVNLNAGNSQGEHFLPEGAHLGPHGLVAFLDYDKGMAYAKKVNKPVLLDFTGHACVNCRKMEEKVWSDPAVLSVLKNEVVLISLYVDDKRELPKEEQYFSEITGKNIRSIGNKWSEFQIKKYQANAQPYYVLLNHKGDNLNEHTAYNPNINDYLTWLKEGINNFKTP